MYGTCCLYGAGLNDFDAGKIHWKGRALKIETLLGPEMVTREVSAFQGPKKSRSVPYKHFKAIKN